MTAVDPESVSYLMANSGWLGDFDLVVARGRSWGLLCMLGWAESRATLTINSKASIAAVYNKADMSVELAAGNLPTPRTFFGSKESLRRQIPSDSYPIILKPIFGDNCRGLVVVRTAEEMTGIEWPEPVALAQSYLPTDGYDLKLYGIGDEVWAVRKPSPFNKRATDSREPQAGLIPLTAELEQLGRRCGKLFGLELYGVDCIETDEGPLVIEINDFPNYTGVPEADERLADYVIRRAEQKRSS